MLEETIVHLKNPPAFPSAGSRIPYRSKNVEMGQNPPRKLKPDAGLQEIRVFLRLIGA